MTAGNVPGDNDVHVLLGAASEDGLGLGHGETTESTPVHVYYLVPYEKAAVPGKKRREEENIKFWLLSRNHPLNANRDV